MNHNRLFKIVSVRTIRCAAQPAHYDANHTHWRVIGFLFEPCEEHAAVADSPDVAVVGELFSHNERASAAVTVEALIKYDDGCGCGQLDAKDGTALIEVKRLASILDPLLYETSKTAARIMLAITQLEVDIPIQAPSPEVSIISKDDLDLQADEEGT